MAQIGQEAKTIAFAKWPVWVKNLKCQKLAIKDSASILQLTCAKTRPKKHLIFEK